MLQRGAFRYFGPSGGATAATTHITARLVHVLAMQQEAAARGVLPQFAELQFRGLLTCGDPRVDRHPDRTPPQASLLPVLVGTILQISARCEEQKKKLESAGFLRDEISRV